MLLDKSWEKVKYKYLKEVIEELSFVLFHSADELIMFFIIYVCDFSDYRIIQQLVNGIIAPTAMPNVGPGAW